MRSRETYVPRMPEALHADASPKPYAGLPLQGVLLNAETAKANFISVPIDAGRRGTTVECYFVLEWLGCADTRFVYQKLNYEVKAHETNQDCHYHFFFRSQVSVSLTATWTKDSIAPGWHGDVVVLITNLFGFPLDAKKADKENALSLFGKYE